MKTIRVTRIALSIAALLVVAMVPVTLLTKAATGVSPAFAQPQQAQAPIIGRKFLEQPAAGTPTATATATATATPTATCTPSTQESKLLGTYAFRLEPATSFATNLASVGDPAGVLAAVTPPNKQNVMRAGEFTTDGACHITGGETYAALDDEYGRTALIDFTWTGTYNFNSDYTGGLIMTPDPMNGNTGCTAAGAGINGVPNFCCTGSASGTCTAWKCYDMTSPTSLLPWQPSSTYPITNASNWAAGTYYPAGAQILPSLGNLAGYVFLTSAAGVSGAIEPTTWNQTVNGSPVTDNTWNSTKCTGNLAPYACCTGSKTGTCTSVSAACTGSGAPYPCCTGVGSGCTGLSWTNINIAPQQISTTSNNFVYQPTSLSNWAAAARYTIGVTLLAPTTRAYNPGGYVFGLTAIGTLPDWTASTTYSATVPNWAAATYYTASTQILPPVPGNAGLNVFQNSTAGVSGSIEPTVWSGTVTDSGWNSASCTAAGTPYICCSGKATGTCTTVNQFCTGNLAPWPCCTGAGTGTCVSVSWTSSGRPAVGEIVPTAGNPGGYVFEATTTGTSGGTEPAACNANPNTYCTGNLTPYPCCTGSGTGTCSSLPPTPAATCWTQTIGGTVSDGTVTWTNKGLGQFIAGGASALSGDNQPVWSQTSGGTTTDGALTWTNEGVQGTSGTGPTWGTAVATLTTDGAIAWQNMGTAPLTPIACNPSWEANEAYSTSLSITYGRLELGETDNVSVANASCTSPGTPFACCTGTGTGTCLAKVFMQGQAASR